MRFPSVAATLSAVFLTAAPAAALDLLELRTFGFTGPNEIARLMLVTPCGVELEDLPESYTSSFQHAQLFPRFEARFMAAMLPGTVPNVLLATEECIAEITENLDIPHELTPVTLE